MLELIRERSKGVMAWIIIILIIIPFALWGIDQFNKGDRAQVSAKVNGEPINAYEVDRAFDNIKRQYQENFGDMYQSLVKEDVLRQQVIDDLVQRSAVDQQLHHEGFAMSDQLLSQIIQSQQVFQDKGVFSLQRYEEVLKNNGFTKDRFEQAQRQFMLRQQLESMVSSSEVIGPAELKVLANLESQEREIAYLRVDYRPFLAKAQVNDEQVRAYYDQHSSEFRAPEQVSVDYIELSVEQLAKNLTVSDDQVRAYYQEHPEKIQLPEKRNVRHILIRSDKGEDAAKDAQAKEKIESILAQLKQGADFAALAKQYSEDPGSATKGGELGFFQRGDMVPEFEEGAFALAKPGDISPIIHSSYGYHILQLVAIEPAKTPSFEEAKDILTQELKLELAQKAYNEQLEQLKTLTFEQDDSLTPAAEKLGLKVQTSASMTRQNGEGVFAAPQVIDAAFSDKVIKDHLNSAVIEAQMGEAIVMHVHQYDKSHDRTLDEVKADIVAQLKHQQAVEQAKAEAEQLLKAVQNQQQNPAALTKEGITWKDKQWLSRNADVPNEILSTAFTMPKPTADHPSWIVHSLASGDSVVIGFSAVRVDKEKAEQAQKDLTAAAQQVFADAELEALTKGIKDKARIEIVKKQ